MNDDFCWKTFDESNFAHEALKGFLLLDVQFNPSRADNILMTVSDIQQGKINSSLEGGNGYFCKLDINGAQLELALDGIDDREIPLISLDEFSVALVAWQAYCQSRV